MSFAPRLPLSGVGGWALLKRVEARHRALFERSPDIRRNAAEFAARIGDVRDAGGLVGDRRLLSVALTAFGLEAEIDKRAFIRAALESDPADRESFAGRLVDRRYKQLAAAFGYGAADGPNVSRPGFAEKIVSAYKARSFERALGESDPALRLALNARRELPAYAASRDPDGAAWYALMGDRPVREVLEKALGLPESFARLDLDRQRAEFRKRMRQTIGESSLSGFAEGENVEKIIHLFLARESATSPPPAAVRGQAALMLLQQGGGFANLVQSRFRLVPGR